MARYKVVVKDGDYGYNAETGKYGVFDRIVETKSLAEAVGEFMDAVNSAYVDEDHKATLTFTQKAKKVKE